MVCFHEIRRCYIDGSYAAVVLLCQAFVERELAAQLYAAGWEDAKNAPFEELLERAHHWGMVSEPARRSYRELASLGNSLAHFRSPIKMIERVVDQEATVPELLAGDARRAIEAMASMVWTVPSAEGICSEVRSPDPAARDAVEPGDLRE